MECDIPEGTAQNRRRGWWVGGKAEGGGVWSNYGSVFRKTALLTEGIGPAGRRTMAEASMPQNGACRGVFSSNTVTIVFCHQVSFGFAFNVSLGAMVS